MGMPGESRPAGKAVEEQHVAGTVVLGEREHQFGPPVAVIVAGVDQGEAAAEEAERTVHDGGPVRAPFGCGDLVVRRRPGADEGDQHRSRAGAVARSHLHAG